MQRSAKRTLGILAAAAALLAAAIASSAIRSFEGRSVRRLSEQLAGNSRSLARSALEAKLRMIASQAQAAASLPQIRGQIATFDTATLRDGFRSEAWWAPFRDDFSVYGVSLNGPELAALEGMNAPDIAAGPLIEEARARHEASGLLLAGPRKWPYAAGAAVIDVPRGAQPAVIFLATAIDQTFAQDLAARVGGAVMVSDGRSALLTAGNDAEQRRLLMAVGHEREGTYANTEDPSWSAAATPLVGGVQLWTYASAGVQAGELRRESNQSRVAVFALGLAVAAVSLFLGLRGPKLGMSGATGDSGRTPANGAGISGPAHLLSSGDVTEESEGVTALSSAPRQDKNVFGRYVLMDRLGEGGMAEVYTAVTYGAEGFRRTFVVKRLRPEMARNDDVVSAFIDEANLASSLVHTNIVPVFDFGKVNEEYYLAQEYILGRDLGRLNRRSLERDGKPLPLAQVFYIAHETLKALDYAHNKLGPDGKALCLVHRDVSPNNILISARGEVKLFDFGIAKAQGRITQTQFGTVKGNVRFMSPEQARGEMVDGRSDLFAIGLVIYYALVGDALYTGETAYNLLVKAAQGLGEKERESLTRLPREAQRVLERALQPEAGDRFQSAAEFAAALAPFIAGAHDALSRSMERLFGEDIRAEEARFASARVASDESQTNRFAQPGKTNG
jgi:serine/threonine-protein kinase